MQYVALLLARPARAVHVLDLIAEVYGVAAPEPGQAAALDGASVARPGEVAELTLDRAAAAAYRARAAELSEELEQARGRNDLGAIEARERELAVLRSELIARFHPRHRSAERARKAVYNCIRAALTRIAREHPELGRHLRASVKTGTSCEYRPERDRRWQTA